MTFSESFETQWKSFSDYIVSALINCKGSIAFKMSEEAAKCYKNQSLRWEMSGQYNAEWLKALRAADPAAAEQFEKTLKGFSFEQVEDPKSGSGTSGLVNGAIILAAGAAGFGIGALMKLPVVGKIIAVIAAAVLGCVACSKMNAGRKDKLEDAAIDAYEKQLSQLGQRLLSVVKRADGKEPAGLL